MTGQKKVSKKSKAKKKSKKKAQVKKKASSKAKSKKSAAKKSKANPAPRITSKVSPSNIEKIEAMLEHGMALLNADHLKFDPSYIPMATANFEAGNDINDLADLIGVTEQTVRNWTGQSLAFHDAIVRGQASFIKGLRARILDWMAQGKSLPSFASQCNRSRNWLYELQKKDPQFAKACEIGYCKSLAKWEDLGMSLASGSLQRIKTAEPVLNKSTGEPILDSNGEILKKFTYAPTNGDGHVFKHMTSSRFEEYRPDRDKSRDDEKAELDEALAFLDAEEKALSSNK